MSEHESSEATEPDDQPGDQTGAEGPGAESGTERPGVDPELFGALEAVLLGQEPHLSRLDVIERTGVTSDRARDLWLSLGFPSPASDHEVLFTDEDVAAIDLLAGLVEGGIVDPRSELALTRSMGRTFSRLAEWEIAEVAAVVLDDDDHVDMSKVGPLIDTTLPALTKLQEYVWRRHLANAAGRLLLHAADDAVVQTVGFADIVGYTRRTRSLSKDELADMVERFESTVNTVISNHGGRIIKTIGDEVLFVLDDPVAGGHVALALVAAHEDDETFPEVRVGMAHGRVLARLGDVFGETVNVASRLTSIARPGRVLINRELRDHLKDRDDLWRVRRARTTPVKGYSRLETWALKPLRASRS